MNTTLATTRGSTPLARLVGSGVCVLACVGTALTTAAYVDPGGEDVFVERVDVGAAKHGGVEVPQSPAAVSVPSFCPRTADAIVGWLSAEGPNACKRELRGR